MFGSSSSNKSQESFLELFQSAAAARSSISNLDSPKKEALKNILTAKASISSSPVATSETSTAALKNFLLNGIGKDNSGSSEAFDTSNEGEVLVKFKKASLEGKGIPGGMIAVSGSYLAYLVNERKVRIFNLETGQKCSIDRTVGVFVGLAWSDARGQPGETCLAVLAEDGEVTIGKISSESGEELSFEVFLILSFPEIGRARAISWNSGGPISGKNHLAVYGTSTSDIFFVHCSNQSHGKSSFVNTSVQEIRKVDITESGACWVVGRDGFMEKFKYSGSSSAFEPEICAKLPIKKVECVKIFEKCGGTYCLVIADGNFSVFTLDHHREDDVEPILISTVPLEISASEFILNQEFDLVLLFSNALPIVQIISLQSLHQARTISHSLNPNPLSILDACFKSNNKVLDGGESYCNFSLLFYFTDSICLQNGQFELLMLQESEPEDEAEEDSSANEIISESEETQVEPFSMTKEDKKDDFVLDNFTKSNNNTEAFKSFDMDSLKFEIKSMVREAVKECLIESIHEVMSASIQAGFNQISEDLMALTKNLIKSVEGVSNGISVDVTSDATTTTASVDDGTQAVRLLISQGQLGLALRKAATSNSRLLLEVCQKYEDPFSALDEEQLPQLVLTQMFSLLSLDIDEDTEVKLEWLQEILIQIDFSSSDSDSGSAENAQILAERVDKLFNDLKSLVNDSLVDGNLQKKMKTVMRLLRKLQMN